MVASGSAFIDPRSIVIFRTRTARRLQAQPRAATVLPKNALLSDYTGLHREAFDADPDQPPGWIHFPFPWGSPEAAELQSTIWKIDSLMWKHFLQTIRDEQVPGDLLEFGVSAGNSLKELITYCEELDMKMKIYGFDSFEGLPEPSSCDPNYWHKGEFAAPFESVSRRLGTDVRPHVRLLKGWFSETLADPGLQSAIGQVAFARIDCDLYQSTAQCLAFLENRLSSGAYLCFDDWTDNPETGETKAFFEFYRRTRHKFIFKPICRISLGGMHMRVFHA
jgi:Macrocin-O-methyltransferase (TylF)